MPTKINIAKTMKPAVYDIIFVKFTNSEIAETTDTNPTAEFTNNNK